MLGEAGRASLAASTATLADALGTPPALAEITRAVVAAFERVLGVTLEPSEPTASELAQCDEWAPDHVVRTAPREA